MKKVVVLIVCVITGATAFFMFKHQEQAQTLDKAFACALNGESHRIKKLQSQLKHQDFFFVKGIELSLIHI